jgi:hypothetical protein
MRLEARLKKCGYCGDSSFFRQVVQDQFRKLFPDETDEAVLCNPSTKALPYCESVRQCCEFSFPEDLILSTLINERKRSRTR